ncbi:MAG TPA: DUF6382 domain-containing protein [Lachnospiraceae bacterium]|nr:DUF6382 domain-containing protein [Lachnospiraceae bacterium]
MQQNLLVLRDQEINGSIFQEKMLEHNQLEGFLPFRVQHMNGERMIFYDLCGVQPLSEVCHMTLPNVSRLTSLVHGILQAIRIVGVYLLKEDDILLSLEYMFVRLPEYQVKVCYYPGYQIPIKKQISQLFEVLMSCVDYEDRDAVYLMYSLYMKSKEESCTVIDLEQLLTRENELESEMHAKVGLGSQQVLSNSQMLMYPQSQSRAQEHPICKQSISGLSQMDLLTQAQPQMNSPTQSRLRVNPSTQLSPQMNHPSTQSSPQMNHPSTQSRSQADPSTQSESQVSLSMQSQTQMNSSTKSQQQLTDNSKEHCMSQDIPLAMSATVKPPELGIGQSVISRKSASKEVGETKNNVFRPLISNHREVTSRFGLLDDLCFECSASITSLVAAISFNSYSPTETNLLTFLSGLKTTFIP